jgi:outer membrane protein assembly factor BamE (lipoprotein component of BamABCDE complex)
MHSENAWYYIFKIVSAFQNNEDKTSRSLLILQQISLEAKKKTWVFLSAQTENGK